LNAFFENWLQVDRMPLIQAFMSMTAQLSSVRFWTANSFFESECRIRWKN